MCQSLHTINKVDVGSGLREFEDSCKKQTGITRDHKL